MAKTILHQIEAVRAMRQMRIGQFNVPICLACLFEQSKIIKDIQIKKK